jgi:hypothetical protein
MKGIHFSRSSNYDFQIPGAGRKKIPEYVGIAYSTN